MMALAACFRRAGSTGSPAAKDGRRHGAGAGLRGPRHQPTLAQPIDYA
jgi:hypothetical protein